MDERDGEGHLNYTTIVTSRKDGRDGREMVEEGGVQHGERVGAQKGGSTAVAVAGPSVQVGRFSRGEPVQ